MEKWLRDIQGVEVPISNDVTLLGDLFFTPDSLIYVVYSSFSDHSTISMGKYGLAGIMMGGIGGGLLGISIDSFPGSKNPHFDKNMAMVDYHRVHDYDNGRSVSERLTTRGGVEIKKKDIDSIFTTPDEDLCVIRTTDASLGDIVFYPNWERTRDVISRLKIWKAGNPIPGVERINVVVSIIDFINDLENMAFKLSKENFNKLLKDTRYFSKLSEKIPRDLTSKEMQVIREMLKVRNPVTLETFNKILEKHEKSKKNAKVFLMLTGIIFFIVMFIFTLSDLLKGNKPDRMLISVGIACLIMSCWSYWRLKIARTKEKRK